MKCETCRGTGVISGWDFDDAQGYPVSSRCPDEQATERCRRCAGKGLYTEIRRTRHPWIEEEIVDTCPTCHGSGRVPYGSQEARR